MESLDSRDAVLELILALLAEEEFQAGPSAGVVLQAYLRDSPQTLDTIVEWIGGAGAGRTTPLTVRLVKGAYWDHEIVEAAQHGWKPPVFEVKAESDVNFEQLTTRLVDHRADGCGLRPAIASHNLRSVAHAIAYNRLAGGDDADIELQILRGLGDALQEAVAAQGLRVRAYCPVGDLVAGMAYLVRRLLENTSNDSFLNDQAQRRAARAAARAAGARMKAFANEPILELRRAPIRAQLAGALEAARRAAADQGAGVDRRRAARGRRLRLHRPRHARPRRGRGGRRHAGGGRGGARARLRARSAHVGRDEAGAAGRDPRRRRGVAARAAARDRGARGPRGRQAVARGRRRRVRGDRLPRVLRARRARPGPGRPAAAGAGRAQRAALDARAASSP